MESNEAAKRLRSKAIAFLARREHSRRELSRKLSSEDVTGNQIQSALQDLIDQGLQSDQRFCEVYTRMRKRKGYGPVRVKMELQEKGVAADLIEDELNSDVHDWFEAAKLAWQKKFGAPALDQKERAKHYRFLQYRGFTSEQIHEALSAEDSFSD